MGWARRMICGFLAWLAPRLLSTLGRAMLILWAFVSGFWCGVQREWAERDQDLQASIPSPGPNDAPTQPLGDPTTISLPSREALIKVAPEVDGRNVVVFVKRPNT